MNYMLLTRYFAFEGWCACGLKLRCLKSFTNKVAIKVVIQPEKNLMFDALVFGKNAVHKSVFHY